MSYLDGLAEGGKVNSSDDESKDERVLYKSKERKVI